MSTIGDEIRPLGWAGLLAPIPRSLRPSKIDGDAARGLILLADRERTRLELAWATVHRSRFDARPVLERRLVAALDKADRGAAITRITAVAGARLDPMLHLNDARRGVDRFAGYCPATRRVIQMAYHPDGGRDDERVRRQTAVELSDQPLDSPVRWAILGCSFTTPPGMAFQAAKLNLGDMQVRVGPPRRGEWTGPVAVMRQIYPARLALARQSMELWMQAMMDGLKQVYRGPRPARRVRNPQMPRVTTARGQALHVPLRIRWAARVFLLRCPGRRDLWLLHDEAANRLVGIHLAGDPRTFEPMLDQLVAGLHWAGVGATV